VVGAVAGVVFDPLEAFDGREEKLAPDNVPNPQSVSRFFRSEC
jgi:hypothetical protein